MDVALKKRFYFTLVTYCVLLIFTYILAKIIGLHIPLTESSFLHFDSKLYQEIKINGYASEWLCAFFPGFPFLWRFLGLSALGMTVFNLIIFLVSFTFLAHYLRLTLLRQIFFSLMPSFAFMFLPYSEALFFSTTTLVIIGFKKDNTKLALIGLLLSSLVRPTTFVFLPALLISLLLFARNPKQKRILLLLGPIALLLGLSVTFLTHYYYTHKWFIFFESQKIWKNYLHLPSLPFHSWGGNAINRYDAASFLLSISAFIILTKISVQRYFITKKAIQYDLEVLFSLAYISFTLLTVVFYRDGNLYSLNRFIIATPFLTVALNDFINRIDLPTSKVWGVFFVSELCWLLFESYNHIHNFLMFSTISVYFTLLYLTCYKKHYVSKIAWFSLIALNLFGLSKLVLRVLVNGWLG